MSETISRFIVDTLIEGNIINDNQRNLYEYCFNTIAEIILSFISAVVIGVIFHQLAAVLIFMAVFFTLRSFCGGFHCETSGQCFIMSMVFLITAICSYPYICSLPLITFIITAIINGAAVIFLSPVEGKYKHIGTADRKRMKLTAIIITVIIYAVEILLYMLNSIFFYLIAITVLMSFISMIAGKISLIIYHSTAYLDHSQGSCKKL